MRGCVRLRSSRKTFNRVRRVHGSAWVDDRFALDRSLVLLVSDYITWRAVENCVAAIERARLRTAAQQSQNIQPSATGTPRCWGLRPLRARSQPRVTRQRLQNVENCGEPCSRCRACEAAYGCAAVAKPFNRVRRVHRGAWVYDRFALDRSLVLLVSDYKTWRTVENRVAAVERARLRTAAQQS